ncbi:MAG: M23 family metallopeptidase [Bacteroidota bacterium]
MKPIEEDQYIHPIAFGEYFKLIAGPKYNPDHGDFHDPIINPQVRGWYGSRHLNKDTKIPKWNPYASLKFHEAFSIYPGVEHLASEKTLKYGKPQRSSGSHKGLDIYAPVGTPVYASHDGEINTHGFAGKIPGFKIVLIGKYKGEFIRTNYVHLMQFEKTRFRFFTKKGNSSSNDYGWLNYDDFLVPQEKWQDPDRRNLLKDESYFIHYNNGILKIDQNEIDIEQALKFAKGSPVKKGEIIGFTGSSGNSYQGKHLNHLHFNLYIKDGSKVLSIPPYEDKRFKEYYTFDVSGEETSKKQDGLTSSENW